MRPVVSLVPTTFQQIESCERSCRRTAHLYPAGKQEAKRAGPKVAVDKHDFSCVSAKLPEICPPPPLPLPCTAVVEVHLLVYQSLAGVCIRLYPWCLQHVNRPNLVHVHAGSRLICIPLASKRRKGQARKSCCCIVVALVALSICWLVVSAADDIH